MLLVHWTSHKYDLCLQCDPEEMRQMSIQVQADEMLTLKQTRHILKVSRNTMYLLVREGIIPARKVGSEWRIMRSVLIDWMQTREN